LRRSGEVSMQHEVPEVLFCDLCNTSVPLQDVTSGAAVRHQGKTIGGCCLASLRGAGPSPAPLPVGLPAGPAPTAAPTPSPATRGSHDGRLLPLGIAVLVAVAAATLFLDLRIDGIQSRWQERGEELAAGQRTQGEAIQEMRAAFDGIPRRPDLDAIAGRLQTIEASQQRSGEQHGAMAQELARASAMLQAVQQAQLEAANRRVDYGPALEDLRRQLQQQAVSLGELLAQPRRAEPAPASAEPMPPMAVPGLSPELALQVQRLKDPDAATRFEAVDELLRSKLPEVLEHLLPMTKDADTFVRRLCVEGLKDFVKPAAVEALIASLGDAEEIVRDTAWRSLKELTGQKIPFEPGAGRDARARAQQKWQEWWDKNRDSFGT
jgi:hypothetical protein